MRSPMPSPTPLQTNRRKDRPSCRPTRPRRQSSPRPAEAPALPSGSRKGAVDRQSTSPATYPRQRCLFGNFLRRRERVYFPRGGCCGRSRPDGPAAPPLLISLSACSASRMAWGRACRSRMASCRSASHSGGKANGPTVTFTMPVGIGACPATVARISVGLDASSVTVLSGAISPATNATGPRAVRRPPIVLAARFFGRLVITMETDGASVAAVCSPHRRPSKPAAMCRRGPYPHSNGQPTPPRRHRNAQRPPSCSGGQLRRPRPRPRRRHAAAPPPTGNATPPTPVDR